MLEAWHRERLVALNLEARGAWGVERGLRSAAVAAATEPQHTESGEQAERQQGRGGGAAAGARLRLLGVQ